MRIIFLFIYSFLSLNCFGQSSIYTKGGASWRTVVNSPVRLPEFDLQYGGSHFLSSGYTPFFGLGWQNECYTFKFIGKNWKILSDTEINYSGDVWIFTDLLSLTQMLSIQYNHGRRSYFALGPSISLILVNRNKHHYGESTFKYLVSGVMSPLSIDLTKKMRAGLTTNIELKPHLAIENDQILFSRLNFGVVLHYFFKGVADNKISN